MCAPNRGCRLLQPRLRTLRASAGSAASEDDEGVVLYRASELDDLVRSIAVLGARVEGVMERASATLGLATLGRRQLVQMAPTRFLMLSRTMGCFLPCFGWVVG